MPDKFNFNHLPNWGVVSHRCIVEGCDFPGPGRMLSEADRARHARQHARDRKRELEAVRLANLREGRRLARLAKRENELVDDRG